jgi:hypothetical protein
MILTVIALLLFLGIIFVALSLKKTVITEVGPLEPVPCSRPRRARERIPYAPLDRSKPRRVQRIPADPIDAIDPDNPLAPTLREQYRQMGDNRSNV